MAEVLDVDLTDFNEAYNLFVLRADEVTATVWAWYVKAFARPPATWDLHHAFWRVIAERERWGTLRVALQNTWPHTDGGGSPVLAPPNPGPNRPPAPPSPAPGRQPDPPSPGAWLKEPIRVTPPGEAFAPRMMSDRANAWVQGNGAYVFAGSRETGGPLFFQVDLQTGHVLPLGPMVSYGGETEFWSWTPNGKVMIAEGPRLHRVDPFRGDDEVVLDSGGHDLHQWHSSDDGTTHSATVKQHDEPYQKIGTVVERHGKQVFFAAQGALDESQVSRDGRFVIIKENRGTGDDTRIIELDTRETTWLRDQERGIGHSDCGPDYVVGEADKPDPGGCVIWRLDRLNEGPRFLFPSLNVGYLSCRGGKCLWSNDTHLSLVALDGSGVQPLLEHGANAGNDYDKRVKANLSPCGRVATYMVGGSVYLLVLP